MILWPVITQQCLVKFFLSALFQITISQSIDTLLLLLVTLINFVIPIYDLQYSPARLLFRYTKLLFENYIAWDINLWLIAVLSLFTETLG